MKIFKPHPLQTQYHLDANGCFVIENYNHSKAFSNFFPGVAGLWGIPMWVFYVNRGQGIASFGIESKDKAILEFQPANKAYRLASLQGFRTFIKIKSKGDFLYWEPFQNNTYFSPYKSVQKMCVTAHDLTIEDHNLTLGLKVRVNYFTMPEEDFPALVRVVTVENLSKKNRELEMIDGLPIIVPYGMNEWTLKNMSRTAEAWVQVHNLKEGAPYFHLNVDMADRPDVKHIEEGNFYFSFEPVQPGLLDMIVENQCVFGNSADFRSPERFLDTKHFSLPRQQEVSNRMPCAMSFAQFKIGSQKKRTFVSVVGQTHAQERLQRIVKRTTVKGFIAGKAQANRDVVARVRNFAFTHSASPIFDLYSAQTFLDNVLRGGLPVSMQTGGGTVTFNVFSRKHGDMERDYNYFVLAPTPFSQGNGNYRDVNQNRRNDVWFNPDVQENSVIDFFNLLQADGFNPLVVKGLSFLVNDHSKIDGVLQKCVKGGAPKLKTRLQSAFQPGELLNFVMRNRVALKVSLPEFLGQVLTICHKVTLADHGEGYWCDHWTYNLDLVESYLAIYPEKLTQVLLENRAFSFYHNSHYLLPRSERYLLTPDGVRQYHSVKDGSKEIKAEQKGSKLRTRNGEGQVYLTSLFVKLLCLITNKAATLDPSGIGIEMDADKPAWCDALNGLPGLLGSSISETLELKRYAQFLLDNVNSQGLDNTTTVSAFEELMDFIVALKDVLKNETDPLNYWQRANEAKEHYRSRIRFGIVGDEHNLSIGEIKEFLSLIISRTEQSIEKAKDRQGLIATYFYHDVTEYEVLEKKSGECAYVLPRKFKLHRLPLSLEGFVHYLRAEKDRAAGQELFGKLQKSELFDKKLKMYKINADLTNESEGIGRLRIFPRGWLENESIWLHMEYKYLLELLRRELYDEFFVTFKQVLVPFLDPAQYGRSTLENSSFLVSSAHEDKNLHGQGFVARLSGSTAEFLHIWLWMNVGKHPFRWSKDKGLTLKFTPALPGWLFSEKSEKVDYLDREEKWQTTSLPGGTYAFMFLGSILTVYHNPRRKDTFHGLAIKEIVLTYPRNKVVKLADSNIPLPYSQDIRDRKVDRIDMYF